MINRTNHPRITENFESETQYLKTIVKHISSIMTSFIFSDFVYRLSSCAYIQKKWVYKFVPLCPLIGLSIFDEKESDKFVTARRVEGHIH